MSATKKRRPPKIIPGVLAYRRPEAAAAIGCGISKLDEEIAAGKIKAKKTGKNLIIPVAELERYISELPDAHLAPAQRRNDAA
jgi:hypothetical protein